jgi:hypothetical protein
MWFIGLNIEVRRNFEAVHVILLRLIPTRATELGTV